MTAARPRAVELAHASAGRLRLRLRWLREDRAAAVRLAEQLTELPGIDEVAVRPWTGSVLCTYDAHHLDAERIIAAVRRHTQVTALHRAGDAPAAIARRPAAVGSGFRRALGGLARSVDASIVDATDGHLDLGALAGLGFLVAGAAEIGVTRQLPVPPWFNLAWWAFRTFAISKPEEQTGEVPAARRRTTQPLRVQPKRRRS
jgi:hypothetical protein